MSYCFNINYKIPIGVGAASFCICRYPGILAFGSWASKLKNV